VENDGFQDVRATSLFLGEVAQVGESPIERRQREFIARSKIVRPAKTAGSEYMGILLICATVVAAIGFIFYVLGEGS
jgi:hypothetical protein